MNNVNIYANMRKACADHDTTITVALLETGHSSGSTGSWKAGKAPRLDLVMDIADYLHVSLDELVYGKEKSAQRQGILNPDQREWLSIIDRIPAEKQEICKDFLRTHMVVPDKYVSRGKINA